MILAAHLPTYFPNMDFLYKLCKTDVLVLADNFQFSKHGLVNRARIKTARSTAWLTAPVLTKGRGPQSTNDVLINRSQNWTQKHLKTISVNYKYAAYFGEHEDFLADLYGKPWERLIDLNLTIIDYFVGRLSIQARILLSSDLQIGGAGQEWIGSAMEKAGCRTYLVEEAYRTYLSRTPRANNDFALDFFAPRDHPYHQQFGDFVPGLSALDLLLNEGRESRKIILGDEG